VSAREAGFITLLRETVRGEVRAEPALGRYTTYRVGGPGTVFLPADAEDVVTATRLANRLGVPWFALGLGSNILLPDQGMDALVIRLGKGIDQVHHAEGHWTFGAGLPAPLAARRTAAAGWGGIHMMVGVPGTVGGGVYMNAGCHGGEWAQVVLEVTAVDAGGESRILPGNRIPFSYRHSGLRGLLILETRVALHPADPHALEAEVAKLFAWRQQGTPFNQPCCGSVFRNPVTTGREGPGPRTAGQLIEAAGLKGRRIGAVEVSPMHANYFVNTGGATAADVQRLIQLAQEEVLRSFDVLLEPEVKVIAPDGRYV
jgi:UDP-N-acetylmuramate dehydrogenase